MRILFTIAAVALVAAFGSDYAVGLLVVIGLQAFPAVGLALLTGYTGQISLGHAAFYGLGAYGAAILGEALGLSAWLDILLATAFVAIIAWAIGWVVFRLRGHYLAMATLAFGIIVQIAFVEMDWLTGGPNGMGGIASLSFFGHELFLDLDVLPVIWATLMVTMLVAGNLISSPTGTVMRAIGSSERAAASLGTDVQAVKRKVMMLSGALCAIGGGLYAHYIGYLSPGPFDVSFSIRLLLMVAIGGFSNIWGVLFGVVFVTVLGEVLKPLGAYDVVAFGALLVASVILFPKGLLNGLGELARKHLPLPAFAKGMLP